MEHYYLPLQKNNFNKLPSRAINKDLDISKNKSDIER